MSGNVVCRLACHQQKPMSERTNQFAMDVRSRLDLFTPETDAAA